MHPADKRSQFGEAHTMATVKDCWLSVTDVYKSYASSMCIVMTM